MFDLEQSIARWRREMLNAGIPTPTIDELESHLREEIERQMRAGLDARFALDSAVAQIGRAVPLKEEFAKTGEIGRGFLRKIKSWFHIGGFCPPFAEDWDPVAKQALDFAVEESRHFRHDFIGTEHVLMGLIRLDSGIVRKV